MSCLRRRSPASSSDNDAPLPLPLSGDRGPCKRNVDRFPADFMFQLSLAEWTALRSQVVITVHLKGRSEVLPVSLSYVHLFGQT